MTTTPGDSQQKAGPWASYRPRIPALPIYTEQMVYCVFMDGVAAGAAEERAKGEKLRKALEDAIECMYGITGLKVDRDRLREVLAQTSEGGEERG